MRPWMMIIPAGALALAVMFLAAPAAAAADRVAGHALLMTPQSQGGLLLADRGGRGGGRSYGRGGERGGHSFNFRGSPQYYPRYDRGDFGRRYYYHRGPDWDDVPYYYYRSPYGYYPYGYYGYPRYYYRYHERD